MVCGSGFVYRVNWVDWEDWVDWVDRVDRVNGVNRVSNRVIGQGQSGDRKD